MKHINLKNDKSLHKFCLDILKMYTNSIEKKRGKNFHPPSFKITHKISLVIPKIFRNPTVTDTFLENADFFNLNKTTCVP